MIEFDYSILRCPHHKEQLDLVKLTDVSLKNVDFPFSLENVTFGFQNSSY